FRRATRLRKIDPHLWVLQRPQVRTDTINTVQTKSASTMLTKNPATYPIAKVPDNTTLIFL
ncbi:hypothetical protein, partial [Methanoregula sp.]|uniref:hypothetical protein n=1 Tax=Methanoregula sp. TaxID=2052170 RepID=UPI003BAEE263